MKGWKEIIFLVALFFCLGMADVVFGSYVGGTGMDVPKEARKWSVPVSGTATNLETW